MNMIKFALSSLAEDDELPLQRWRLKPKLTLLSGALYEAAYFPPGTDYIFLPADSDAMCRTATVETFFN